MCDINIFQHKSHDSYILTLVENIPRLEVCCLKVNSFINVF